LPPALLTRGHVFWLRKASDSLPRDAWLFLQGQFLTSQFYLPLYHRSNYSATLPFTSITISWEITAGEHAIPISEQIEAVPLVELVQRSPREAGMLRG